VGEDRLLGGRVRYRQPDEGFRSGIEPVLLAAGVPAGAEDRVLEGGTGAGAGLLCLAARVPGVQGVGVERDAGLAALARENFAANKFAGLAVITGDLLAPAARLAPGEAFDHAFANPPWHAAAGTEPLHPARLAAKHGGEMLGAWMAALAAGLRRHGTLALILPVARMPAALAAAAAAECGSPTVFPFWPREGRAAKLVLVRVMRGGRGPPKLLAGLVLHGPDGRFTAAAEEVLRGGAALPL